MSYQFHPEAEVEHLETIAYYEAQQPGLGASYLAEFESALERVCEAPSRYQSSGDQIFAGSDCRIFPSPCCFANPEVQYKFLPLRIIAVARLIGSAGSNRPLEWTAHPASFFRLLRYHCGWAAAHRRR